MKVATLNDLMVKELNDLYSAEQLVFETLPKMEDAASSSDLKKTFHEHRQETQRQIERLDEVYKELGISYNQEECKGMEGIIQEGEEIINMDAEPSVRDAALIATAQKVEHYEIASYGTMKAFAKELGFSQVENLVQETLDEEGDTDKRLTRLATGGMFGKGINWGASPR